MREPPKPHTVVLDHTTTMVAVGGAEVLCFDGVELERTPPSSWQLAAFTGSVKGMRIFAAMFENNLIDRPGYTLTITMYGPEEKRESIEFTARQPTLNFNIKPGQLQAFLVPPPSWVS